MKPRPAAVSRSLLAPMHLPQRCQSGFTLIELITVMLIIGIMAVAVLPRLDLIKGFDEIGYRDKVKATLEYARKAAVAQRRYSCVSLAGNNLTVTIDLNVPESYVVGTCPASALSLPAVDRSCSPAAANKICAPSGVSIPVAPATLVFSPLGRPAAASNTYTVRGESDHVITVEAETGYVH
ncbi:MAG: type II secretion system protein [Rhodocyclales bacterium]|nr:type II secretion system protein [Rhodocyclales bacterium]